MQVPQILQKSNHISRKQTIVLWIIFIAILSAFAYAIPAYFIGNGIAQIAPTPQEEYYAEKALEYRAKYLREHGFKEPIKLKAVSRNQSTMSKEELRSFYHCANIPEGHFDELYEEIYKYTYTVKGYSWFGIEDSNASNTVMGCALYKVGI